MHGPWHMPEHPDEQDNGDQERLREEADAEAQLEAAARDPEEEDQPPYNDDGECSFCRSHRIESLPQGVFCLNCGSQLYGDS